MRALSFALILTFVFSGFSAYGESAEDNWPSWRGPNLNGIAVKGDPPVTWSETENIKWKIALPGTGSSTPIVWGDKLFLQTAVISETEPPPAAAPSSRRGPPTTAAPKNPVKFNVVCIDRNTGELLWERTVREEVPHEGHHPTGSYASYSPVTDGKLLWASFGSRGLHCMDLDGNLKWSVDLGRMRIKLNFGEGSSPALAGDLVIVQQDHEGSSKIMAFQKETGDLIWEQDRKEGTSWSTPMPVEVNGQLQVVSCATNRIRCYDAKTGELLWHSDGLTPNSIPSPVVGFGNVYCTSGFRGNSLQAIELGHTGDLTDTDAIKWSISKGTPYVSSPLLYGDNIYVTSGLRPILSCYDARTGEPIFVDQKLEGMKQIYASPVGVAGRIYLSDREGHTTVLKQSGKYEVLALNTLDDGFDSSPVVIGDALYLKGATHLYCIAKQ